MLDPLLPMMQLNNVTSKEQKTQADTGCKQPPRLAKHTRYMYVCMTVHHSLQTRLLLQLLPTILAGVVCTNIFFVGLLATFHVR